MVKDVDTFSLFPLPPPPPPLIAQNTFYAVRTLYFITFQLAWGDGNLSYLREKEYLYHGLIYTPYFMVYNGN